MGKSVIEALQEAFPVKLQDTAPIGAVVHWKVPGSRGIEYTYLAFKTPGGWYTTSANDYWIAARPTFDQLVEYWQRNGVNDLRVSNTENWNPLG